MIPLWFVFFCPRLLEQPSFFMCHLCVGFVEHSLGIFTLVVQNWNTWLPQLLKAIEKQVVCYLILKALYRVWNKQSRHSSCVVILGETNLSFAFCPCVHLRGQISEGMCSDLDQLRTLFFFFFHKCIHFNWRLITLQYCS